MTRTHYVKAAKDYPEQGIKKGDMYYWWKFRFGAKHFSKSPPRPSQLTQSPFLGPLYDIQEKIANFTAETMTEVESFRDDVASEIRELASQCEDNLSNMPDGLQQGTTGELLQTRTDECNTWADDIESVDCAEPEEVEHEEGETDTAYDERVAEALTTQIDEAIEQIQSFEYNGE